MKRTRIPALALAVALPFTVAQAIDAPVGAAQPAGTAAVDQASRDARLAAQAIEELINEYRVANGLHALVTHELYDNQALAWTQQMVADLDDPSLGHPRFEGGAMVYAGALRHSDPQAMGYSGENIVFRGQYDDNPGGWRQAAEDLFEDWRNSPSHNANMLSAGFQGMGLGLVRTANGEVWGTTMFFTGELPVRVGNRGNAYLTPDETTNRAEASGVPFYVPAGARERLGVRPVSNPVDTKGYSVTNTVILSDKTEAQVIPGFTMRESSGTRTYILDKSKNAPRSLDPAVTGIPVAAVPTTEKTPASSSTTTSSTQVSASARKPPAPSTSEKTPASSSTTTSSTQVSASARKPPAPSTSEKTPAPSTTTSKSTQVTSTKTTTTKTSPTTSTASNAPAPSGGGSSSAGIVIGVLLALVAVVGAAVVAMPMVMG